MTDPLPSPLKHAGRRTFLRVAALAAAALPLAACSGGEDSLAK
ncbi:hypothetical protein [Glutamicibacter nicotianae]|nr:hypothetical protein [Glutamicibacter nicotianae]